MFRCMDVAVLHALQRSGSVKVSAFPSLDVVPLMVTMVEHVDMSRDYVVTKSIWHLSDAALKSVCESSAPTVVFDLKPLTVSLSIDRSRADTFYAMFTVWGVCFFASMKAS